MKRKKWFWLLAIVGGIALSFFIASRADSPQGVITDESLFDKTEYSTTEPSSIWVVINKQNSLPINYKPDLVVPSVLLRLDKAQEQMTVSKAIKSSLEEMFLAAKKDKVNLMLGSGYRSSNLQKQFYDEYVEQDGRAKADQQSARPGFSEHQTGLAVDVVSPSGTCHLQICWESTKEGKWVLKNSYKYGFIIRYQKDKKNVTGYQYEPWHIRFVGKELAKEINNTKQTLEEFFGLAPAPDYYD